MPALVRPPSRARALASPRSRPQPPSLRPPHIRRGLAGQAALDPEMRRSRLAAFVAAVEPVRTLLWAFFREHELTQLP